MLHTPERLRPLFLTTVIVVLFSACSSDALKPGRDTGVATDAASDGAEGGNTPSSTPPPVPPDAQPLDSAVGAGEGGLDAVADVKAGADADALVEDAAMDVSVAPSPDATSAPMVDALLEGDVALVDTSVPTVDAVPVVTPDAAVVTPDAAVVEPDAAVVVPPDAAVIAPDTAVVVPPDAAVVPPDAAVVVPPDAAVVEPDAAVVVPPDAAVVPPDLAADQGPPCQPGTCKPNAEWVRTATAEADIQTNLGGSVVGVAGGDLYLSATFRRNAVVAGQAVMNMSAIDHTDAFVASFNPSGAMQWIRQVHGEHDEVLNDVTPDPAGNLLMTGSYQATMYLDDQYTHGSGIWVSSLNGAGKAAWLFTNYNFPKTGYSVAADTAGNLYLCGFYTTNIQFDALKLTGDATNKLFVASFGPDRKVRWLRDLGQTFMPSIVVRGVDDIVVGGSYLQLRLDGQTWNATGLWDVFFVALGAGGVPSWTTVFPGPTPVTGRGIIRGLGVDSTGAVYASGDFADASGMHPAAVVALTPGGAFKWNVTTASIGSPASSTALTVGNDDAVYFAARIAGNATFGDWSFMHQNDTYLVRFDPDGRVRWVLDFGSTATFPSGLASLPGGRIGLAGTVQNQSALLGLPLRADGAAVPNALYLLSLKQQ
jgi:hypothetical protein